MIPWRDGKACVIMTGTRARTEKRMKKRKNRQTDYYEDGFYR